jgi:hypothetical protein
MSAVLMSAELVAPQSRRQAFYRIWIEPAPSGFQVAKISGAAGHILHRQAWEFNSLEEAQALFTRRLREKTNPSRQRARVYQPTQALS